MADQSTVPAVTPFYLDKSLYVTILTPICVMVAKKYGVQLNTEEIASFMALAMSFVVGHKWKSGTIAAEQVKAAAAPTPEVVSLVEKLNARIAELEKHPALKAA
jgi:hypothetical protein